MWLAIVLAGFVLWTLASLPLAVVVGRALRAGQQPVVLPEPAHRGEPAKV
jgi:hypothetical protein